MIIVVPKLFNVLLKMVSVLLVFGGLGSISSIYHMNQ